MTDLAIIMAKLSGIRKAVAASLDENISHRSAVVRTRDHFAPDEVQPLFVQAAGHVEGLRTLLPEHYGDFKAIGVEGLTTMSPDSAGRPTPPHYSRAQAERLVREIDQIFEIRANSELPQVAASPPRRVFISHGRSHDWRSVQPFIEKDVELATIELAQEPNLGRTLIEKLAENSDRCDSAVIVMTGDDIAGVDQAKVRENVMHEIGFFQGRYGRNRVILLHEDGVNIPTNLGGVAYIPFPKGSIEAAFHVLQRELKALYRL